MANLLNQIRQLQEQIQSLPPLSAESQRALDQKFRLEFSYNSNHIEGNTLTYGETELLLLFDKTTGNHDLREYEEMKAHDVVFELIKDWAADKERFITEADIKSLHQKLLVRPFWKEAIAPDGQPTRREIRVGAYKSFPNSVRLQNGEIFHYTSVENTLIEMGELMHWLQEEDAKQELHPAELAALLHYRFVRIHPFDDGNGRLSRLLMNYILLRHGLPPVVIKTEDKKNYLFALSQADAGNIDAFVEYICHELVWSLKLKLKAASGEGVEGKDDWKKRLHLLKKNKSQVSEVVPKSETAILGVFDHSFLPLIQQSTNSLSDFDELFADKKITFGSHNTGIRMIADLNSISQFFHTDRSKYAYDMLLNYDLYGYKFDGTNTFNCNTSIFCILEDYKYHISDERLDRSTITITKLYGENLDEKEIEHFANHLCRRFVDLIESRIKS